ncbi:MAG: PadR family transcriptional regulator [Actinomycetota bacterium]|nr:PadR family transcriptional regulator [Actinomycetota bacterium]
MGPTELEGQLAKLNATAASLLGLLHRGPMTGWDLARQAETVIGDFWNVSQSQIYRELRTLEQAGMVEAGPAGPREKKPFTITESGKAAFKMWIRREPGPDAIRSPLLLMVFFANHLDDIHRRRFMAIQRLRHEQTLDQYRMFYDALANEPDLANVLQFAIFHEEAVQRWFEWMDSKATD